MRCQPKINAVNSIAPLGRGVQGLVPIILGSKSPRRGKILRELGCRFEVCAVDTPEMCDAADPVRTVVENATAKYQACRELHPEAAIITADTLVWFDGRLIGKPNDMRQAADFLRGFSGQLQVVYTAVALGTAHATTPDIRVEAASVRFKKLSECAIAHYLARTQPLDRAGAYDIDESGDLLIAAWHGSRTNIMGLPAAPVRDWLRANHLISER